MVSIRLSDLAKILGMLPPKPVEIDGKLMHYIDPKASERLHQIRDALEAAVASNKGTWNESNQYLIDGTVAGEVRGNNEWYAAYRLLTELEAAGFVQGLWSKV